MKNQKYKLEKNCNGTVTQVLNGDGGSVYDKRPELRKLNQEALKRPTPGKLGDLSNLQIFNFNMDPGSLSSGSNAFFREYNTTVTTGNVTDCVMFGTDSLTQEKALYYNIVDVKGTCYRETNNQINLLSDSYVEFYLVENIETSTTSLGRKIPRRAPLNAATSGEVVWTVNDAKTAYQSIKLDLVSDSVIVPQSKGLRASGLALKQVDLNFNGTEDMRDVRINFQVIVDITSVSSTY